MSHQHPAQLNFLVHLSVFLKATNFSIFLPFILGIIFIGNNSFPFKFYIIKMTYHQLQVHIFYHLYLQLGFFFCGDFSNQILQTWSL
jgi:hypothetical protein